MSEVSTQSFAFVAQTLDGRPMSGTVNAAHLDEAAVQLHTMHLRVIELRPADVTARKTKTLPGDEFLAFNDQLAHLTKAGLPIEQGLRLLASDLRDGRLAPVIRAVADELDRGKSLAESLAVYRGAFPPLYAKLVDAGIRSGDLGGMLLSLGQHVETGQKLRRTLWQAAAYPLMVLVALAMVMALLSWFVFPTFESTYSQMGYHEFDPTYKMWVPTIYHPHGLPLPPLTRVLFRTGPIISSIIIAVVALLAMMPVIWRLLQAAGLGGATQDSVLVRLPLVGRALRMNLLARWCETVRLGATAGLDLPGALRLAGETIDSPSLRRDTDELIATLERGLPLEQANATAMLPAVVPSMIDLAARSSNLPAALTTLSTLYQQQAEIRIRAIPTVLLPLLMIIVASLIGFVLMGLMLPLLRLVNEVMRGFS